MGRTEGRGRVETWQPAVREDLRVWCLVSMMIRSGSSRVRESGKVRRLEDRGSVNVGVR